MVTHYLKSAASIAGLILLLFTVNSCRTNFYNLPSQIEHGGRTVAVAISPENQNLYYAASETGGVFTSTNGGNSWLHYDTLPFSCFDLKIAPDDQNLIIVSASQTSHVLNRGGIWRSDDGGISWTQPTSALPRNSEGIPRHYSTYGISFMPGKTKVYVGSDSGVVYSDDLGLTWRYINPNPDGTRTIVYSVLALSTGKVFLYTSSGVWISEDGLSDWQPRPELGFGWGIKGAFASSPLNNDHIFFTNDFNSLWFSLDGGETWRSITTHEGSYDAGREPFVKVVRSIQPGADKLDIYYSNRALLSRKSITWTGADYDFSESWEVILLTHFDPADIAFANDNKTPLIIATDGGIDKAHSRKNSWRRITNPSNFFNALQVFDVKGMRYTGASPHLDLHFGTQDNGFWASSDGGSTWPYSTGNEGFGLQGPPSFNTETDSTIIYNNIGSSGWVRSGPHYYSPEDVSTPALFPVSHLCYVGGKTFIQFAKTSPDDPSAYAYVSNTEGRTWRRTGISIRTDIIGYLSVSGPASNPSIFAPIGIFETTTESHRLIRFDNLFDDNTRNDRLEEILLPTGCRFGIVPTMWPWYAAYAVAPDDPNKIIIPDVNSNTIWITGSGSSGWRAEPHLLRLVLDGGRVFFHKEFAWPQVRTIQYDPANSANILVGTMDAGIIYSRDGGSSWIKLPDSERIPSITSFYYYDDTTAFVSTYGRGLFKIYPRATPIPSSRAGIAEKSEISSTSVKLNDHKNFDDTATFPALFIVNALHRSGVNNVAQGIPIEIFGYGWKGGVPVSIKYKGKEFGQNVRVDPKGNFRLSLPASYEPVLHELVAVQSDQQQHTQAAIKIKVSIVEGKPKAAKIK